MEAEQPRWRNLLGRIRTLQIDLQRTGTRRPLGLAGNPGAPSSAIRIAELRLSLELPPSYRQFLLFTDGWPAFFEGASLLGTADIGRPSCLDLDLNQHGLQRNPLLSVPQFERFLPFGASPDGKTLFAFDTKTQSIQGEMAVVAWIGGLGLDCRNFTEFLATVLQLCRTEAAGRLLHEPEQIPPSGRVARSRRARHRETQPGTLTNPTAWESVA